MYIFSTYKRKEKSAKCEESERKKSAAGLFRSASHLFQLCHEFELQAGLNSKDSPFYILPQKSSSRIQCFPHTPQQDLQLLTSSCIEAALRQTRTARTPAAFPQTSSKTTHGGPEDRSPRIQQPGSARPPAGAQVLQRRPPTGYLGALPLTFSDAVNEALTPG